MPYRFESCLVLIVSLSAMSQSCAVQAVDEPQLDPGGEECGEITCTPNEFCDWRDNACGNPMTQTGTCKPRPAVCLSIHDPACGCDGEPYGNSCHANAAGTDAVPYGKCGETHVEPCGNDTCTLAQYCEHVRSDVPPMPDSWTCRPLPAACTEEPSCTCLERETCAWTCEGAADVGFSVACRGG